MSTSQPTLRLADGTLLVGSFEETVGSQVVLSGPAVGSSSQHPVQLLGHTDRSIRFRKPRTADAESEGAAADSTGLRSEAAAAAAGQQPPPAS